MQGEATEWDDVSLGPFIIASEVSRRLGVVGEEEGGAMGGKGSTYLKG